MTSATSSATSAKIPVHVKKNRTVGDWVILALLIVGGPGHAVPVHRAAAQRLQDHGRLQFLRPTVMAERIQHRRSDEVLEPRQLSGKAMEQHLDVRPGGGARRDPVDVQRIRLGHWPSQGPPLVVLLIMLANMLPQEAMLYPLYIMFKNIGLYNSPWAIVIIFTVIQSAFGTYLLSSVYGTFPKSILEAAAIDGASRWTIFRKIVFPISKPTLSVMLVFFFIWTWNEYMIPMAFLIDNSTQTIPIAVSSLTGDRLMDVTTTAAASLISIVPTLIFYLIFQRTLSRGITAGAVK